MPRAEGLKMSSPRENKITSFAEAVAFHAWCLFCGLHGLVYIICQQTERARHQGAKATTWASAVACVNYSETKTSNNASIIIVKRVLQNYVDSLNDFEPRLLFLPTHVPVQYSTV